MSVPFAARGVLRGGLNWLRDFLVGVKSTAVRKFAPQEIKL